MAKQTVFYSWQSDLPNGTNRSFIERCLSKAISELKGAHPKLDPCLDRDTADVPGSPDIAATILDKIDNCSVFVCDVSIVQDGKRAMPNPNVLFELGYAVQRLGWERVVCVANTHFGAIESLPFDVRQRRVKGFTLDPDSSDRKEAAASLTSMFRRELELILSMPDDEGEKIQLQFGDLENKSPLGKALAHDCVFYACDIEAIPDYQYEDDNSGPLAGMSVRIGRANRDYHRELVEYVQQKTAMRKVGLVAYNGNSVPINDLTLALVVPKSHGIFVLDDEPYRPDTSETNKMMRDITPISAHFARPGKLKLTETPDRYEVHVEFGKVQPEATAWSEPLFLGAAESCQFDLAGTLYADELKTPVQVGLRLSFNVTEETIDQLPNEAWGELMQDED
ncbi:MAG: hypothetical protein R3C18_23465 [Planctomycetaceae bacterium]